PIVGAVVRSDRTPNVYGVPGLICVAAVFPSSMQKVTTGFGKFPFGGRLNGVVPFGWNWVHVSGPIGAAFTGPPSSDTFPDPFGNPTRAIVTDSADDRAGAASRATAATITEA